MKKGTVAVFSTMIGAIAGVVGSGYLKSKTSNEKIEKVDKFKRYYHMLNQWLTLKQENKSLEKFFIDYRYKKIAIYGMGEMGIRLFEELKESSIEVKYAIDKNGGCSYFDLDVFNLEDELTEVDAIVVSAIFAFNEIKDDLCRKINCPIISLDDVVFES